MTLLIANLGTSDLSVRPQGKDFYLPIQFDRNEPNLVVPDPNTLEASIWRTRETLVCDLLCTELGVGLTTNPQGKTQFLFREFTEKLWLAYQQDPDAWHDRLRPGRIWGVIRSAQERFGLSKVHLFVSDQQPLHPQDTVHLFEILRHWLKREMPTVKLKRTIIPPQIALNQDDPLLEFYAGFFKEVSNKLRFQGRQQDPVKKQKYQAQDDDLIAETERPQPDPTMVLVSIKGGTPQMQTALRIQTIASAIQHQAMLEPQLTVQNVLQGKPSPCQAKVYWQYAKSQRYQTASLLLSKRWDFDGAAVILNNWQYFLNWLVVQGLADEEVKADSAGLKAVVAVLRAAQNAWNLDHYHAQKMVMKYGEAGAASGLVSLLSDKGYDRLLNLYTQCRIFWKLNQTANFFVRMSSFYEEVQLELLKLLEGERFLVGDLEDWTIDARQFKAWEGGRLWQLLKTHVKALPYHERFDHHPFERKPEFQVMGRDNKSALLKTLLVLQPEALQQAGEQLLENLQRLDFWASTRNKIIHQARGPAAHKLQEHLDYHRRVQEQKKPHPLAHSACDAKDILEVMTRVCASELNLVRPEYQERYLLNFGKEHYYIYGEAQRWALKQLM